MTGADVPSVKRWPLVLIAAPAAVAIWSGWVGLGQLCGFGPIHPLPGIADSLVINTAITLPIGVEAYGAYALRAWLTPGAPERAQQFARRSAFGALALGMCGQVIYHLLSAAHAVRAPWPVVMLVSCIPVITLGFGAALTHLLKAGVADDATPAGSAGQRGLPSAAPESADAGSDVRAEIAAVRAARIEMQREALESDVREPRGGARTDAVPGPLDRDVVVALIAEEIRDAIEAGERWHPDYPALMERTGRRRSWCEKAVRDARMAVLDSPDDRTGDDSRTDADAAGHRTDGAAPGARTELGGAAGEPRTDDDPDGAAGDRTGELVLAGAP